MSEKYHAVLQQLQKAGPGDRTPFCPDDQQVAEYFDGGLKGAAKAGLERHLAECRHCRARIGVIQRVLSGPTDRSIPGEVLADAKRMAGQREKRAIKAAPVWAVAALLLVALATFMNYRPGMQQVNPNPGPAGTDSRQVRSVNPASDGIRVLRPVPGDEIRPGSMLEWGAVPESLHYDIFVLTGEGDLIATERVRQPGWILDRTYFKQAEGLYYFRVVAYLPDGRKLHSHHVPFKLQRD